MAYSPLCRDRTTDFKELRRLYPPVYTLTRRAVADDQLGERHLVSRNFSTAYSTCPKRRLRA